MTGDHDHPDWNDDRSFEITAPIPTAEVASRTTAPLGRILADAYHSGREGVITVALPGDDGRIPITVRQGRVISVAHPKTTIQGILDALTRAGIVQHRDVERVERESNRRGVYLEDHAVESGLLSRGTIAAAREKAAVELLMDLLLRRDIETVVVWSQPRGTREMFALPIPYLLKEAQRRAQSAPVLRRAVPDPNAVFAKTRHAEIRWEDLKISAAERQVFFFVDGYRTVSDLAMATCQSEFEVMTALHALLEMKLVSPVEPGAPRGSPGTRAGRASLFRIAALLAATVAMLCLFAAAMVVSEGRPAAGPAPGDAFAALIRRIPEQRVLIALRMYDFLVGGIPSSFDDLLNEGLATPEDRRAWVALSGGLELRREGPSEGPAKMPPENEASRTP